MKKTIKFGLFLALALLALTFGLDAQSIVSPAVSDGLDLSSLEVLFSNDDILFGALVVLGGYLSSFIPGLKSIDDTAYRVAAWALLTGVGFFLYGAEVTGLAFSYLISNGLYTYIFRLFKKTPSVTEADAAVAQLKDRLKTTKN